jgi:hypothetical protein
VSANEALRARGVAHAVYLERYKSSLWKRIAALLDKADADLVAQLQKRAARSALTEYRLELLLAAVRDLNAAAMKRFRAALREELRGLAGYELDYQLRALRDAVPPGLETRVEFVAPAARTVYAAAVTKPFQGRLLRDWARGLERSRYEKAAAAIRLSVIEGEPIALTVQRLRGTRARRYQDGVLAVTRREAEAISRTAINHVVTKARDTLFAENDDVVKGVQWVSTLDARTCWSPEAPVLMADGSWRPIGDVRVGDWVIGGASGAPCRVAAVHSSYESSSVAIYLSGNYIGRATHDHRVLSESGWIRAADLRVPAGVPHRQVLCRRHEGPSAAGGGAPGQGGLRRALRAVVRDPQVRHAESHDCGGGPLVRGGVLDRDVADRQDENAGPARLQHDGRRRGVHGDPGAAAQGDRPGGAAPACGSLEVRPRVSATDDRCLGGCGQEDLGGEQGVLRHPGGACNPRTSVGFGLAAEGDSREPATKDECGPAAAVGAHRRQLERPRVPGEGERGARGPAGRATGFGPRLEGGEGREDGGLDAGEVAGPRVSRENACACGHAGGQGEAGGERPPRRRRPDARGPRAQAAGIEDLDVGAVEYAGLPIEDAGVYAQPAEAREAHGRVEIISLSIEGDETYVVGGLIVHNTPICQGLDGKVFPLDSGPRPPAHINCRSATVPVLKSWREMGIDRDEVPAGTRASMNGQVAATETYGEWLRKQPAAVQEEALGKAKARLFRDGGLTVDRFAAPTGRAYTLDELRAREARAFEKAGVE